MRTATSRPSRPRRATALAVVIALLAVGTAVGATLWTVSLGTGSKGQAQTPSATPVPTGVTATCFSGTADRVTVTWTAETGAKTYTVYYSTASTGPWNAAPSGSITAPTVTYTSGSGAIPNGSYYFAVTTQLTDTSWAASTQSAASAKRTLGTNSCA